MLDVITFGSATKDIFLSTKESAIIESEKISSGKGVCFPLGSKVKTEEIYFTSGGGGTNTAVTFAKQGLSVAYCGKVGDDSVGRNIIENLQEYSINTSFTTKTKEKPTNHSVIIDVPDVDRTIFVYRGASDLHKKDDIPFDKITAKWFYLAPFSVDNNKLFLEIIDFAVKNNIKIMANPSKKQLAEDELKESLKKVNVLLLNLEEASILTQTPIKEEVEIIKKTSVFAKEVVLVTKGVKGVIAFDNKSGEFFHAKPVFPDAIDRTGAGDSFGAGFLSKYIQTENIEKSLQLGVANSTSCLQKKGAKHGLLSKNDEYQKPPVIRTQNLNDFYGNA